MAAGKLANCYQRQGSALFCFTNLLAQVLATDSSGKIFFPQLARGWYNVGEHLREPFVFGVAVAVVVFF